MSEAGAVATAGLLGIGGATLLGFDVNAVIGAFAGAMFFVVYAKDVTGWGRIGYFIASWIAGYYISSEFMARSWAQTSGLIAAVGAAVFVVIAVGFLDWAKGGGAPAWLRMAISWLRNVIGAGDRNG